MCRRSGSDHVQTDLLANNASFFIKVVKHFHVIRQESDRVNHDVLAPPVPQLPEMIEDIWLEPGITGSPAPALVDKGQAIRRKIDFFGDQSTRFGELMLVLTVPGHRHRDAMGGERDVHLQAVSPETRPELGERARRWRR